MRMLWSVIFVAAIGYAGIAFLLFAFQSRLVFFPDPVLVMTPADAGLEFEDVWLRTDDGVKLHGWYVPAQVAGPTMLFFHGNAGNISHRIESLQIFHRIGLNVLIFDYRGYGRSEGAPSESGSYRDAEAAWKYLTRDRGLEPADIALFGRSLGGAVAAWLASEVTPAALILESSFTSVPDLAAQIYRIFPVRMLARIRYPSAERLTRITCPILVVHSRDDDIIPFSHGEALFAAANEPKQFFALRGSHNEGFLVTGDAYTDGLAAFLDEHLPAREPSARDPGLNLGAK